MAKSGIGPQPGAGSEIVTYSFSGTLATSATFSTAANTWPTNPVGGVRENGWLERGNVKELVIAVHSDKAGATTALRVDQSMDGSAVHGTSWEVTYASGTLTEQIVQLSAPYFRFEYTNSAALATAAYIRVNAR
jgi:hypothetical protein